MLKDTSIIIAIAGQLITWVGIVVLFSIAWGRLTAIVGAMKDDVIGIKREIHDPDHRILTEDKHREICDQRQSVINLQLDHICKKLDSRNAIDSDVFERLRMIETNITEIKAEFKIKR